MREEVLRNTLAPHLPDVELLCGISEKRNDVVMAAVVDGILHGTGLPRHIRVTRLVTDLPVTEIAVYCLARVLQFQRNLHSHRADEAAKSWNPLPPKLTSETTVGVLGLSVIGRLTAKKFASLGYKVIGWSKSQKQFDGIDYRFGDEALDGVLKVVDYLVCILPYTDANRDFIDSQRLALVKPNAVIINAERGDFIVGQDLIAALDTADIAHAVSDIFRQDPMPGEHPFW